MAHSGSQPLVDMGLSLSASPAQAGSLHCTGTHQHGEVIEGSFAFGVRRLVSGITHIGESR